MNITLHGPSDLSLTRFDSPGMDVASEDSDAGFAALEMFATSMALCTGSVLVAYGETLGVDTKRLAVRIRWQYAEDPYRVSAIRMDIEWPELPASRIAAAQRAASQCTIHNTLHAPPEVHTEVHGDEE